MAEDSPINSHFKDCLFALPADYTNHHNKHAHYFLHDQLDWCSAAAICFVNFCAVFLRSLLSERFRYVCLCPVYGPIHMR